MAKINLITFFMSIMVIVCTNQIQAQNDYGIHDPSGIVKENDRYYTFYTSNGVEYACSDDLCTWKREGRIFSSGYPSWINTYVPGFEGHFWAPQIFYMNNKWHVYYSCSTFGSRQSAIGLATTPSLIDPDWQDQGMVVFTNNSSDHNAIDADVFRHDGKIWLIYGSFWSGIVMTELDTTTGKPVDRNDLHYVADGNPEAAFAIYHGEYYYLFFNRGKCCDGVNSTYYINVGRSKNPAGPFLDQSGKNTSNGGGSIILETRGRFIGPGHFGYFSENGKEYMSYHYYDRDQNGISKLKISTISWQNGWPVVNTDFDPCNSRPIEDCAGVENGTAYVDNCGNCVGGTTGKESCIQDCNGDWGGSAFEDQCGVCAGGKTDVLPCNGSIQGEDAYLYDGVIENTNEGYLGDGYLNLENKTSASASWKLCSDTASNYMFFFRFANGGSGNRNISLLVNEEEQIPVLEIPETDSWTDWQTVSAEIFIPKGENDLTLAALSNDGAPNIDIITFPDNNIHKCKTGSNINDNFSEDNIDIKYRNGIASFHLEKEGPVCLRIFSVSGQLVKKIFLNNVENGNNRFHIKEISGPGIYLFLLENNNEFRHKKLISVW